MTARHSSSSSWLDDPDVFRWADARSDLVLRYGAEAMAAVEAEAQLADLRIIPGANKERANSRRRPGEAPATVTE